MADENKQYVESIPLKDIIASEEFNCRGKITPLDVRELAEDIQRNGLLQPVVVCPATEAQKEQYQRPWFLIAGFRRHMAHQINNAETIKAIVREDAVDPIKARIFNFTENLQRKQLNIVQEAENIERLVQFGLDEHYIAQQIGKSRGWVQVRAMLLKLPKEIREDARGGAFTQTDIRELYAIFDKDGEEPFFEAVKTLKNAKLMGRKVNLQPKNKKVRKNSKKLRKKVEIFEMMQHIQESGIGNGLWTRALAWAACEIRTGDFIMDLKEHALNHDIEYKALDLE